MRQFVVALVTLFLALPALGHAQDSQTSCPYLARRHQYNMKCALEGATPAQEAGNCCEAAKKSGETAAKCSQAAGDCRQIAKDHSINAAACSQAGSCTCQANQNACQCELSARLAEAAARRKKAEACQAKATALAAKAACCADAGACLAKGESCQKVASACQSEDACCQKKASVAKATCCQKEASVAQGACCQTETNVCQAEVPCCEKVAGARQATGSCCQSNLAARDQESACCQNDAVACDSAAPCCKSNATHEIADIVCRECPADTKLKHLRQAAHHLQAAGLKSEAERVQALAEATRRDLLAKKIAELQRIQAEIAKLNHDAAGPQQVLMHVKIVELSRTKLQKLGFSLPRAGIDLCDPEEANQLVEGLCEQGVLKVLAAPDVVTVDGRECSYRIGAEACSGGTTHCRRPTTEVDTLPTLLEDGKIRLEIRVHHSEPDTKSLTGVRTRMIDVGRDFVLGKTAVIGGLVQQREPENACSEAGEEVETVLFITPEIVKAAPPADVAKPASPPRPYPAAKLAGTPACEVSHRQQVLLHVKLAEVSRTKVKKIGFDLPNRGIDICEPEGINGLIDVLCKEGIAKVLATPDVAALDGRGCSQCIVGWGPGWAQTKTYIDTLPMVLADGRVRLQFRVRHSEPDAKSPTGERTQIIDVDDKLPLGKAVVISGLLQQRTCQAENSCAKPSDDVELMLVITPELIKAARPGDMVSPDSKTAPAPTAQAPAATRKE